MEKRPPWKAGNSLPESGISRKRKAAKAKCIPNDVHTPVTLTDNVSLNM